MEHIWLQQVVQIKNKGNAQIHDDGIQRPPAHPKSLCGVLCVGGRVLLTCRGGHVGTAVVLTLSSLCHLSWAARSSWTCQCKGTRRHEKATSRTQRSRCTPQFAGTATGLRSNKNIRSRMTPNQRGHLRASRRGHVHQDSNPTVEGHCHQDSKNCCRRRSDPSGTKQTVEVVGLHAPSKPLEVLSISTRSHW